MCGDLNIIYFLIGEFVAATHHESVITFYITYSQIYIKQSLSEQYIPINFVLLVRSYQ